MGRGQWTRWGRGMCEGWSLEIGMALHGSVVRRDRSGEPPIWIASINSTGLGEFLEREIAMLAACSPRNHLSIAHEFPCQFLRCVKGKPNWRVGAFSNVSLSTPTAHIGPNPSWAGCAWAKK